MTPDEVSAVVARELAAFRYDPPAYALVGTPWSAARVARGVEELRAALVPPRPVSLAVPDPLPPFAGHTAVRPAWIVAEARGYLVVYDPAAGEFGLAEPGGGADATDIHVRGDLVGTFLAA